MHPIPANLPPKRHQSGTLDTSTLLTAGIAEQIGEVKEKITKEKGWEASTQKLIYSGAYKRRRSDGTWRKSKLSGVETC